jgi:hypothetical protein
MKKLVVGAFLVTLAAAAPARAQDDRPVHLNIGGGFTVPLSDVSDRFGTGGGFNIGVIFEPAPLLDLQVEYSFNKLGGEERTINLADAPGLAFDRQGIIESQHEMHYFNFNGMVKSSNTGFFKAYGVGGGGMYYRAVSLTTPDVGFTTVCDPYWYACFPAAVEVDQVIGDRNSWDPGINIGGGVTFNLGSDVEMYVESRWHYIWGPEFIDADGLAQNANGQYIPVTFGFRF